MNSIKIKVLLLVICSFLLTIGIFFSYSFYVRNEYREVKLKQIMESVQSEVRYVNRSIYGMEQTVKNIAITASYTHRNRYLVPHDDVNNDISFYLLNEQYIPEMIVSSGVWFEPYAFYDDERDFAVFAYRDNLNKKINTVHFDNNNPYAYQQTSWYKQILPDDQQRNNAIYKKNVFWTTPGELEIGNARNNIAMIGSYIYDEKNNVIGVAAVGWPVSDMVETLSRISISENSKVLLADIKHNKVIGFNNELEVKNGDPLQKIVWSYEILNNLPSASQVSMKKINVGNVPHYAFTAMTDNDMLIASVVPENELLEKITKQSFNVLFILAVLSLILIFATLRLIDQLLNKPIQNIVATAEQINSGIDEGFDFTQTNVSDEIHLLLQSLNGLIKRNNATLSNLLDSISNMLFVVDINNFKISYVNNHTRKVFPNAQQNQLCYQSFHNKEQPCQHCPLIGLDDLKNKSFPEVEIYDEAKNKFFKLQTTLVEWNGAAHYALVSISDVTKDVFAREKLEAVAETDPLTGLLNRRGGIAAFERMLTLREGVILSVVSADLNGLKYVNDNFGHAEGDFYLNSFVMATKENLRESDIVSRFGGDEFLLVLPNCKEANAIKALQKINETMQRILVEENKKYSGSMAFGVQEIIAKPNVNIQEVLDSADQKMYFNKKEYYKNKNAD